METMIINQQNKINYTNGMQQVILDVANTAAKMVKLSPNTELSIMIVDNSYIKELNLIYRGENNPTDVLSFAMNELTEEEMGLELTEEVSVLGDIVVSLEKAVTQSEEYGHSVERELGYLIAHGMLHLLGYDHEDEEERKLMRSLEERIMHKVKLER